jgi:cytochrome c oxidase assembly protein subunit 11
VTASGDHDGTTVSVEGRARRNNRLIGVGGVTLAATMLALTYGAAPFYSAFCRATGYEGTPQHVKANTDAEGHRILRVGFDANVAPGLDWSFEPETESIRLRTGQTATI